MTGINKDQFTSISNQKLWICWFEALTDQKEAGESNTRRTKVQKEESLLIIMNCSLFSHNEQIPFWKAAQTFPKWNRLNETYILCLKGLISSWEKAKPAGSRCPLARKKEGEHGELLSIVINRWSDSFCNQLGGIWMFSLIKLGKRENTSGLCS